jgi:CHASE2 domain-containing sensor protein
VNSADSVWTHLWKVSKTVLIVSLLTLVLDTFGLLRGFETGALDWWQRLKTPKAPERVIVVGVTEEDFRDKGLFRGVIPLDPGIILELIRDIAQARPSGIAVDIDTGEWQMEDAKKALSALASIQCPVIWARDSYKGPGGLREPLDVLGGAKPPLAKDTGLALLPRDQDGEVRAHQRMWKAALDGKGPFWLPSFPWAVVQAVNLKLAKQTDDRENLILNFRGDFYNLDPIPASEVLQVGRNSGVDQRLKDKVVLVGNFYHAARDQQSTPLGDLAGVQVMAEAVESELSGGGIRAVNEFRMLFAEIVIGFGLSYAHYRWKPRAALLISLLAIVVVSPFASFIAFSSAAMWVNFVPILTAVLIHELYDQAQERRKLEAELQAFRTAAASSVAAPAVPTR